MKHLIFLIILWLMMTFAGCDSDKDCSPATYGDNHHVPEDSICLGTWQWVYSLKYYSEPQQYGGSNTFLLDTIFPGDYEPGFETIEYAYGTITNSDMCFNINGEIFSGCYGKRFSSTHSIGTTTMVDGSFHEWNASGWGYVGMRTHLPEEPGDTISARISGLLMFPKRETSYTYYDNWFVKID